MKPYKHQGEDRIGC